jgi:superfamily II DNA or RNA helicase
MNRDERQRIGLNKWQSRNYQGIACYPTGFGKTYTAIRGIKGLIKRKNIQTVEVIVPTIELKNQWEKELRIHKINIAKVTVINTAIKYDRDVDFLILDEIHRYAAETFKEIFSSSRYEFILGLTATLEREDGLHDIILKYMDVFDEISVVEALKNKWISEYKIYNIAVPLPTEEAIAYKKSDNGFKYFASKLGYGGIGKAQEWMSSGDSAKAGIAAAYYNSMRTRKKLCLNNSAKLDAVVKIVELFPSTNGLIFSATTEFADNLQKKLGDIAMTFHSKLTKRDQDNVIKKFKDKRTKVRILSSVAALNEGFNVPDASIGIITGSNSTKRTFIQQLGRIVRYQEDKIAIFINLYSPETQEENWLKKKLEGIEPSTIYNITLNEFINQYK